MGTPIDGADAFRGDARVMIFVANRRSPVTTPLSLLACATWLVVFALLSVLGWSFGAAE